MQLVLDEATVVADAHFCCCKVHKKLGRDVSLMSEKVGSIMGMEELVIFFFLKQWRKSYFYTISRIICYNRK